MVMIVNTIGLCNSSSINGRPSQYPMPHQTVQNNAWDVPNKVAITLCHVTPLVSSSNIDHYKYHGQNDPLVLVNQHSTGKPAFSIGDTSSNGGFPIARLFYRSVDLQMLQ